MMSICYNFLNAAIFSVITLFFRCIKLNQTLSQFSAINLAQVLGINTFGRDYSDLISSTHARFIVEDRENI